MDYLNQALFSELAAACGTALALACYYWLFDHGYLGAQALRTFNESSRKRWVHAILGQPGSEVLAVQVLRNSIMTATVMASTCVLLVIATMSLVSDPDKFAGHWLDTVNVHGLWRIKVASLMLFIFLSFWHYAQAVRMYGHVGYLLGIPKQGPADREDQARQAISLLNTAGHMFSNGNRYFFFSLSLALWWFGVFYLVCGAAILTTMGWLLDRRALSAAP